MGHLINQVFLAIDNNIGKNPTKTCQYIYPQRRKEKSKVSWSSLQR